LIVKLSNRKRVGINVGKSDASGMPIPRELSAMEDLANFGNLPMYFVSYKKQ
jgi:hypothetical protein